MLSSIDTEAPPVADMAAKVADVTARGWPFLVAEVGGAVAGYAYATQFRDRPAYRHTCENSIYVAPDRVGSGLGRALLTALVDRSRDAGFHQMVAVIGGGEPASVALHAALGFRHAGRMERVGRKFDRWLDTVYMQRTLIDAD